MRSAAPFAPNRIKMCLYFGTALRLWRSPSVWLVQRVVAEEMPAVLDKQDDIKVVVDMTASV
jgi:hypothetical protein